MITSCNILLTKARLHLAAGGVFKVRGVSANEKLTGGSDLRSAISFGTRLLPLSRVIYSTHLGTHIQVPIGGHNEPGIYAHNIVANKLLPK